MILSYTRKMRSFTIAAVALACFAASEKQAAATCSTTAPCVTYTASGTFSTTVVNGSDTFKLAGQKFNISINKVPETAKPFKTGTGFAQFKSFGMTGTVNSALDPTPVTLSSKAAQIELAIEVSNNIDVFALYVPVQVLGLTFDITATIDAPAKTIPTYKAIRPFSAPVTIGSTTANTVVYSYTPIGSTTPDVTTLTIATGSVSTTVITADPTRGEQTAILDAASSHQHGNPGAAVLRAATVAHVRRQDSRSAPGA